MGLRRFRYFVVCAEELHFTRAAARLGIAQPPLSQQIRVLEDEIGTRLFHRLSRGVELTPAGHSFLRDARAVLEMAERAMASARQIGRGERDTIRIGFTSSASFNPFVPAIISEYRQAFPNVAVALNEATTAASLELLRDGRLDIAFLRPASGEAAGLKARLLFHEPMMVALPARHALAGRPALPLSALAEEPFILYPRANGRSLHDAIIAACQNAGFSPNIVQEAPQLASTVSLVAAGIGIAIVPASMCQLQTQGVTYRAIDGIAPRAALSLVGREGPPSATVENFAAMVRRSAAGLPGGDGADAGAAAPLVTAAARPAAAWRGAAAPRRS